MPKPIPVTEEEKLKVKELFDQGLGSRKIAVLLSCTRDHVQKAYKLLGIYDIGRTKPRKAHLKTEWTCINCKALKPIDQFRKRYNKKTDRTSYETECLECEAERSGESGLKRHHRLQQSSPHYFMHRTVSYSIYRILKLNKSSKQQQSCLRFLPYTMDQLITHVESLFEPWMTWENHGKYIKSEWNDNDPTTWKWQLDHIIPQSELPYSSMTDDNFLKCWDLSNLRPLSAKQNNQDGVKRTRHQKNADISTAA